MSDKQPIDYFEFYLRLVNNNTKAIKINEKKKTLKKNAGKVNKDKVPDNNKKPDAEGLSVI